MFSITTSSPITFISLNLKLLCFTVNFTLAVDRNVNMYLDLGL